MIEVTNLSKTYGQMHAVTDLTFSVQPGRVTGFLGPNGAGKSTTMRLILGLDNPTSGRATINGKPLAEHDRPLHEVGSLRSPGDPHRPVGPQPPPGDGGDHRNRRPSSAGGDRPRGPE
jgi:ABC-type multidrug transport system ATPase subunit